MRVEEPTGLYRRTEEVARVPLEKLGGHRTGFLVTDAESRELPFQVTADSLLFPVTLIPGELPEYKVACCTQDATRKYKSGILLVKLGMRRIELGNSRFRVILDTGTPAMVEAYSLTAGPQRMLNLVETSPERADAIKGDIHESTARLPPPIEGVPGDNIGWTSTGGAGGMSSVEFVESGPLRGRLRMSREGETWEFTWTANSAALRWKAKQGFRFTGISALPYLPFDRFLGGAEYQWPSGPGEQEPPDHDIAARPWDRLPGGHVVYYSADENYGALGFVALDGELRWQGAGSRRFLAVKEQGDTEIAITFPQWRRQDTILEARRENRVLRQPVLVRVTGPVEGALEVKTPAAREQAGRLRQGALSPTPHRADAFSLDGEWDLAWTGKGAGAPHDGWRKVRVPGSAHLQWLDASQVYTRDAEWISDKEWWYRKRFRPPAHFRDRRVRLEFDATDYYADAWLNGVSLGRHEGYIDPYSFDVTSKVRHDTENELLVRVWTPVHYYWKHRPYTVKGAYGAVDQKPDDITALGITRGVRLVAHGAAVIAGVAVHTRLVELGAEVEVELERSGEAGPLTWELTLSPRNFPSRERYQLHAPAAGATTRLVIPVKTPRLWWTWDHGRPNLYTLEVRLLDSTGKAVDGRSLAAGIREIEKIGWQFYLNRKRMFIRGTNYYDHLFLSRMNRAGYERDLSLMLRMNVNMIRLHGHFSNPEFYELADEKGVLVWQDYLEAWYPHDRAFSLRAAALYDNHIRYVRNHPSVAIWATSDEEDWENYRDLTKHLAPRLFLHDPQRRAVIRSTGRFGDSHVYHGWYDGSIWEYTQLTESFVSELGATSLPNHETLVKFMGDKWPIREHEEEWTWRRLQIPEAMRAWGDPGSMTMKEYVPRTQAYVARLFQIALERMRQQKSEGAGGILHFHAIDLWPSVTMAAISIDRAPTKAFDTVRRSFEPVAATFQYDRDQWKTGEEFRCGVWAINDRWEAVRGAAVRWRILDSMGRKRAQGEWPASMTPDSAAKLGDVIWPASEPGAYQLRAAVRDARGGVISENVFEFSVKGR